MESRFAFKTLTPFVATGAIAVAALLSPAVVLADNQPPIRLLVGFPAGGGTDAIARHLAQGLQQELGRSVVVENRPGAGGQIAAQALKAARPDGNTLFVSNSHTVAMIPLTLQNPGFDTAKDFAPVGLVAINPDVMAVSTALLGTTGSGLRVFAQWARANPTKANVGVPAPASAPDFAVGLVGRALGADLVSAPYRGDAPIVQDLVSGQIAAGIGSVAAMLPQAKAGKVRIVAVNGSKRLPQLPDVPTYAEQGIKGYEEVIFTAVFAPAGTPAPLLKDYSKAIAKVAKSAEFGDKLSALGVIPASSTAAELGARVQATRKSWGAMVNSAGYKPR